MAEEDIDARAEQKQQPGSNGMEKEGKDDPDVDEFDKKWADIEYLIRKPFCCK